MTEAQDDEGLPVFPGQRLHQIILQGDVQMEIENMQKIHLKDEWFEVYRLPYQVYAITEPKHFEEVQSFLIKGEKYSIP